MEGRTFIVPNSKCRPLLSRKLLNHLSEASAGAWEGLLALHPDVRHWIEGVTVALHIANDGETPITAQLTMTMESGTSAGTWKATREESAPEFASEKDAAPSMLRKSISVFVTRSALELMSQRKLSLQQSKDECATLLSHEISFL